MKKRITDILFVLLIFSVAFTFSSCGKKANNKEDQGNDFEIKIATNLAQNYMYTLMNGNSIDMDKFYTYELKEMQKQSSLIGGTLKINGYVIDEINETSKSGIIKIKVIRSDTSKSYAELCNYTLKIIKEGNEYKISDVKDEIEKSAFSSGSQLRYKDKNNVKTSLLMKNTSIPLYAFSKDDKGKINKLNVPNSDFTSLCYSFTGDQIVVTTNNIDSFAAVVSIDESKSVQGNSEDSKDSTKGNGKSAELEEKPVGKELISLDLIKDSKIGRISFSEDEKLIMLEYKKKDVGTSIRVYMSDSGEIIKYRFEDNFPPDKVEVTFSSFTKETLNFEVALGKSKDSSVQNLIGKWQLNLKEMKANKV